MSNLDIRNFTRSKPAVFPFAKAADKVLPGWEISLVFAGETRAKALNMQLRNKDYVPNVLSYVSGTKSGEIIICPNVAKKQAPEYGFTYTQMVGFLFIHGLLHLKGMQHSATMDKHERETLSLFIPLPKLNGPTHRNRNRHRNTPHESSGGRRG